MSGPSKIEWTEQTWNPIAGCSIVSPGCTNCYAMRMAARIERMGSAPHYAGLTKVVNGNPVWTGKLAQAPDHIWLEPLRRKKPTMYFVNSMSDLFHEDVPDEWIDRAFAIMALCPQHTFQVLTKRSARMRRYVTIGGSSWRILEAMKAITRAAGATSHWPLPNVWLGVSAERQREAEERVPDLLNTYAAVRFVSAEPLLGPIDFTKLSLTPGRGILSPVYLDAVNGRFPNSGLPYVGDWDVDGPYPEGAPTIRLDWIIVGGESGPDARPMHPDWARSIRDQCQAAGVAFFFKQWGAWEFVRGVTMDKQELVDARRERIVGRSGGVTSGFMAYSRDSVVMRNVGKGKAGRLLDGCEWSGMPGTVDAQPAPEAVA